MDYQSIFVCFTVIYMQAITALQWTSLNTIPNGFPLVACIGQNVSFPWTFDTTALEHEITAEWDFEPPGQPAQIIAVKTADIFVPIPHGEHRDQLVSYLPNAGIYLTDVGLANSGTYSVRVTLSRDGWVTKENQTVTLLVADADCQNETELIALLWDRVEDLEMSNFLLRHENDEIKEQLENLPANRDFYERPETCVDVQRYDPLDGVHTLYSSDGVTIPVFCDQKTDGGGWTVIQRRIDGTVDFYRDWREYEDGFGFLEEEFWLGLSKIHHLTSIKEYSLRIDMTSDNESTAYAEYRVFRVGGWDSSYPLYVSDYSGTAGDSIINPFGYYWQSQNHQPFSTYDHGQQSVAQRLYGGWWYYYDENYNFANLNGNFTDWNYDYMYDHGPGITWRTFSWDESLIQVDMKIRPSSFH